MIFVTGGTGTIGSALLPLLRERDLPVRALARSDASVDRLESSGVEVVRGDLADVTTLAPVLSGCERLFLLSPPHPDQAEHEIALIDAARDAGVEHVVAISVLGADPGAPGNFARVHGEIDRYLQAAGVGSTILRSAGLMQTQLNPASVGPDGRWYGMTGDGAAGYVDARDVAAVAAELLENPQGRAPVYELTGPASISLPQAAATLARISGRPISYVDLAPEEFRAAMVRRGIPEFAADGLVAFYQAVRAGHAATVTHSVAEVTGSEPRSFEQYVQQAVAPDSPAH